MYGLRLRDLEHDVPVPKHVHHQHNGWQISSTYPVNATMLDATPLCRILPGFLGTFVVPDDAVFSVVGKAHTAREDFETAVSIEEERLEQAERNVLLARLNHITFNDTDLQDEHEDEDDNEEEEEGNDVDDDDDCEKEDENFDEFGTDEKDDKEYWEDDMGDQTVSK